MKPIRNTVFLALLILLSNSATAAWDRVGRVEAGSNGIATVYSDRSTVRKAGNLVKMWYLFDYSKAQITEDRMSYLSSKMQWEFDCKEERGRVIFTSSHSENMGGGHIVFSDPDPAKWEPIPPVSMTQTVWKIACGKK